MESNNNELEDIDPDYKINAEALRKLEEKEEEENTFTSEGISKIIAEEFDKEMSLRQQQLEEIEDKICKAQKLLHLVRYVLITSHYNKKSLEYSNSATETNSTTNFDVQNRIHPAVKKLLGKNASLEILNSTGKRRASNKNKYISESSTSYVPATKKPKLEPVESRESLPKFQEQDNQDLQKNRKKTKYRIVIGNISKWMPCLENDNTTHKWMMYVRGMKDTVDISQIVSKVVFYLHPSYKPHDVVEISYPFHLSRRGWGEFPLRVQIFFKNPLNKPVSIVHNLKLDKTYTGRQTLGNETIVDIYLHDDEISLGDQRKNNVKVEPTETVTSPFLSPQVTEKSNEEESKSTIDHVKVEEIEYDLDLSSTNFEHNYCHEQESAKDANLEEPNFNNSFFVDHNYSLPYNEMSAETSSTKNKEDVSSKEQNNTMIYGLGNFYTGTGAKVNTPQAHKNNKLENVIPVLDKCVVKTLTTATGQPIRFLPQSFNKVLLSNGNIIQIQLVKPTQYVLKKIEAPSSQILDTENRVIDYEKYKVTLPKSRFKNMGEVLPYLFKRFPLWNKLASDIDFKCTYPFVASSEEEYFSWSIGKRANSEWCRAKAIRRILAKEIFPDLEKWSTKTFFMYGRSHRFDTTINGGALFRGYSKDLQLLDACFSKSLQLNRFSLETYAKDEHIDVAVDADSPNASTLGRLNVVDISDQRLSDQCAFVKEAALDCGVVLKSEEICEGVAMNAAERMILEAAKCLAEGLVRRARHYLVCQDDFSEETSEIGVNEVELALNERLDIKMIMDFTERKREMEFFL